MLYKQEASGFTRPLTELGRNEDGVYLAVLMTDDGEENQVSLMTAEEIKGTDAEERDMALKLPGSYRPNKDELRRKFFGGLS